MELAWIKKKYYQLIYFVNIKLISLQEDFSQAGKYIPVLTIWTTQFGAKTFMTRRGKPR